MPVRLLVVDDVADIRRLIRIGLASDADIEVVGEAADGLDAIDQASALRPDVVILDIAMPRLDGLNAIPRIHAANPGGHIVMLTGFHSPEIENRALTSCASAFIEKGASTETIAEVVKETAARPPKVGCAEGPTT